MNQRADGASDAGADDLRQEARDMHNDLLRAQEMASELAPLHGIAADEPYGVCATCGDPKAPAYKLIEGERIYICGKCILHEADVWEEQHGH